MEHVWKVGDEFFVISESGMYHQFDIGERIKLINVDKHNNYLFENDRGLSQILLAQQVELVSNSAQAVLQEKWTDKHYDNKYQLSEEDIKNGFINLDVYFVSKQWKIGSRDESGALWHCLKTIARFGDKNSKEREIKALHAQVKCLAKLEGVELD